MPGGRQPDSLLCEQSGCIEMRADELILGTLGLNHEFLKMLLANSKLLLTKHFILRKRLFDQAKC